MEISIRADEISRVLKEQIKNYKKNVEVSESGTVLSVGDGVARVRLLGVIAINILGVIFPSIINESGF
jgi:F-type H+-transporting ATPase subunit alpha